MLACAVVAFLVASNLSESATVLERTAQMLGLGGALFVAGYIWLRAGARRVPDDDRATILEFHRHEIARQRDVLLRVPFLYLLPFVPGGIVSLAAGVDEAHPCPAVV